MLADLKRALGRIQASDDEHIERLRRDIARFDRWRRPLLILYTIGAISFVATFVLAVVFVERLARGLGHRGGWWSGFFVGAMLGCGLGLSGLKLAHGIFDLLLAHRNERLLIEYHDVLQKLRRSRDN
jgi:hypothetical protein